MDFLTTRSALKSTQTWYWKIVVSLEAKHLPAVVEETQLAFF